MSDNMERLCYVVVRISQISDRELFAIEAVFVNRERAENARKSLDEIAYMNNRRRVKYVIEETWFIGRD